MQEGVIKNMTDLQSKYLVKMNDNCRLQNNLSETKTTHIYQIKTVYVRIVRTCTEKLKPKTSIIFVALSHERTTVISPLYIHILTNYSTDARCVEG